MNELDLTNIGITLHIKSLPWTLERTQHSSLMDCIFFSPQINSKLSLFWFFI